jgi:hypothetical protein
MPASCGSVPDICNLDEIAVYLWHLAFITVPYFVELLGVNSSFGLYVARVIALV